MNDRPSALELHGWSRPPVAGVRPGAPGTAQPHVTAEELGASPTPSAIRDADSRSHLPGMSAQAAEAGAHGSRPVEWWHAIAQSTLRRRPGERRRQTHWTGDAHQPCGRGVTSAPTPSRMVRGSLACTTTNEGDMTMSDVARATEISARSTVSFEDVINSGVAGVGDAAERDLGGGEGAAGAGGERPGGRVPGEPAGHLRPRVAGVL